MSHCTMIVGRMGDKDIPCGSEANEVDLFGEPVCDDCLERQLSALELGELIAAGR